MFTKTFGCVRFIYNKMLGDRLDYYKETGKNHAKHLHSIRKNFLG